MIVYFIITPAAPGLWEAPTVRKGCTHATGGRSGWGQLHLGAEEEQAQITATAWQAPNRSYQEDQPSAWA